MVRTLRHPSRDESTHSGVLTLSILPGLKLTPFRLTISTFLRFVSKLALRCPSAPGPTLTLPCTCDGFDNLSKPTSVSLLTLECCRYSR